MSDKPEEIAIPLVSEEIHPGARQVVTGGVRVVKRTVPHEETVQQELQHDKVEVRRVQLNREVEGPQSPRQEGDTLIVPVMEEVLRVERVWILKEEIYLRRMTASELHEEKLVVSREEADVERLDPQGNVLQNYERPADAAPEPVSQRDTRLGDVSILDGEGKRQRNSEASRSTSILGPASKRDKV
jgi:stress response protein YsnF